MKRKIKIFFASPMAEYKVGEVSEKRVRNKIRDVIISKR